ncbi:MAG: hypothetical protein R8K21_08250 [Mariprofundales bacterium]
MLNIKHPKYLDLYLTSKQLCVLSGIGKSIYLHQIAAILPCPDLKLQWDGYAEIYKYKPIALLADCYPRLWLAVSVAAEISYGAPNANVTKVLEQWDIADLDANIPVHSLNRWQSLCVSLAAMDAAKPQLVLLDQPLAGLSIQNAKRMRNMLHAWQRRNLHAILIADNRPEEWNATNDNNAICFWQLPNIK